MKKHENQAMLVKMAREAGMNDEEILCEILKGEYGGDHRRHLVVEWGEAMGLDPSAALRKAQKAGLIPSTHPPRKSGG